VIKSIMVIMTILLIGCSSTEEKSVVQKIDFTEKSKTDNKGTLTFNGITPDNFSLSASGNSSIHFISSPKKPSKFSEVKDEKSEAETQVEFSLDYYWKQTKGNRALLFLAMAIFLAVCIYGLRRTMIGKALDAAGGASMRIIGSSIESVRTELEDVDRNSDQHLYLKNRLSVLKGEMGELLRNKKVTKKFWQK